MRANGRTPRQIKNPAGHCHDCATRFPPLFPTGARPYPACRACNARLYPPGTLFDYCQSCGAAQPLLSDNQRASSECRHCGSVLPPPGQRFLTACPGCGLRLCNVTNLNARITDRCPECRAELPLLEPAPTPPTSDPWLPGAAPPSLCNQATTQPM